MGRVISRVAAWLGLPEPRPGRGQHRGAAFSLLSRAGRGVAGRVRRAGRQLVVRGWASAVVWPGRWAICGGAAGLVLGGLAGLAMGAGLALAPTPLKLICGLRPRCNFAILSDVSSRVNTLKLARRLRRGWNQEMNQLGLTQQHKRRGRIITLTPTLDRMRLGQWGVTGEVDLHRLHMVVADLGKHRERLESVFLARCTITKVGYGRAVVDFQHTDPLSRPVAADQLPQPQRHLHVVTRVAEDGTGVEQDIILPRLVVGSQGSGKSNELRVYLHALQQAGIPFRLRVFDPKGGMELRAVRDAAHRYESRSTRWPDFLGDALAALASRQRSLAGRGWSKLTRFTEAEPLDILVIDELLAVVGQASATVKADRVGTMRADDAFDQYLSQARAAGYTAFALTQLGQKEILGNARGLFPHLTVLRMPPSEKEIVDRLIGSDHTAHLIPAGPRYAGIGYVRDPEGRVVRSRGAFLTDSQWAGVVAQIAEDKQRRTAGKQTQRANAEAAA